MKNKIFKILGVGLTLVMVLALVVGFALPVAASPAETLNEWYKFDYPEPGEDGDWFRDSAISGVGPMAEAINGDLYAAVDFPTADPGIIINGTLGTGEWDAALQVPIDGEILYLLCDGKYLYVAATSTTWCLEIDWDGSGTYSAGDTSDVFFAENPQYFILTDPDACNWAGAQGEYRTTGFTAGSGPDAEASFELAKFGASAGDTIRIHIWTGTANFPAGSTSMTCDFTDWYRHRLQVPSTLMKSTDGGRTWAESTDPDKYAGGGIVDIACSSIDEDIIYLIDGNYVYKSVDGGDEWDFVAKDSLEEALCGACGITITGQPITCIDVGYDADDNPFVFIGTLAHPNPADGTFPGSVYWIGEAGYPATWTDLRLECYGTGYDAYSVGCAPDFADSKKTFVVVSDGTETHVVSTIGVTCSWTKFAELWKDCDDAKDFAIIAASRIGFPDDWEDTETLFVGVVDDGNPSYPGGDVYLVTEDGAIDLNVEGILTGCIGKVDRTNIISLDIYGDTDEASLIAGAYDDTNVYCSSDGGWEWEESEKDPTGVNRTYVLWVGDSALAATSGYECAVSLCCGEEYPCEFWNQISLIATDIDGVRFIDHSPGYLDESETMFMLTHRFGDGDATQSVFRHDGTYWERVLCSTLVASDVPPHRTFHRLRVSPDFLTTNAVFVHNGCFEIWRSLDAGCSWDKLTFPCVPRPCIREIVVIDEDTIIAGGIEDHGALCDDAPGKVYKTTRHGARPWDEYEYETTYPGGGVQSFALEPGYEDPGTVLLGDVESRVYISEDGGETWDLVGDFEDVVEDTEETYVVFDPGYATNNIIYAASYETIARCVIDPDEDWADQEWEDIGFDYDGDPIDLGQAWGIKAAGDTALYVTDNYSVEGSGGVWRSLNPDEEEPEDVVFEQLITGLDGGETLWDLWLTTDVSDEGCAENVLWSLDYLSEDIWVWEDTLAAPVVLEMPVEGKMLVTTDEATLSWKELCDADCYEVELYRYCPECPEEKLDVDISHLMDCHCLEDDYDCECFEDICIVVDDLEPGCTYYWQVRVCYDQPKLSKWSEERTFTTALLAVPFEELCSPPCGAEEVILSPNFSWGAVEGATGYKIELAPTETFTTGVIRGESTVNAWTPDITLDYATTYYWRVRAEKDGVLSDWTVCLFTTMEEEVPPPPPVEITPPPPAPEITILPPPVKQIAKNWIYAIIGIGTALIVVVIVLTVRTRRPPA